MPDYNPNVIANPQVAEYGKFTQLNGTRFPAVSVARVQYPDKSQAFPGNTNALPVTTIDIYPKFGVLTYIANTDDFAVSLSAGQVNLDTSLIELHLSNIDVETSIMANALTATEWNTFDAASGINELNFNFLNAVSALSTTVVNPITIGNKGNSNTATVFGPTSSLNVNVTNTVNSITTPDPVQLDAFGRLRVSTPLTVFDSSHRYRDNNLWSSLTAVGGTYAFNQNQGLMDLTVSALSGSSVIRETTKVFAYQPGKSLLILNTFVFAPSATNLRQRTGYFGADNGIYVQLDGGVVSFVVRSLVNGSPSTESIVPISAWNVDKLNGTGPSGFTLDITKAQILWMDVEWLGVGTVRCGFVIDGKFVHCHSFHHANRIDSTYITTASLPLRYEITNKAATAGSATMKQICSSVISEGGYELRGLQQAVGTAITAPKTLTSAGTYYPVVSIRLKASPNRLDAIVILTALSMMPVSTGNFSWRVIANGTTGGGGAWQDAGIDSAVEYKLDGTSITGGRILAEGYLTANSTYGNSSITNILKEALFKFQLERNGLTKTPYEITLALAASTGGESAHASMDWEEISR
ncbi:hypothetical protein UFOVP760_95 [uncultured Caudovirales phage]|uniref:Uncharacterized protein n=1 Tax=uncultured Caudovirales phage TaxID=2100421 RepID=A0A6J7X6Q0_9CAUD|nr:hypothetical protein UFOVP760_95 [uncultured Caudovirales phage]